MLLKRIVEKQLKNFGLSLVVAYTLIEHRELIMKSMMKNVMISGKFIFE